MRKGFTLVELSIVLVIIGLLIGGILVAQSMIAAAQVTATVRQIQQFDAGIEAFKSKYKFLPGDAPALSGDGNGSIDGDSGNYWVWTGENYNFWNNLDPQDFNYATQTNSCGNPACGASPAVTTGPNKNVPLSKIGKAGSFYYVYQLPEKLPAIYNVYSILSSNQLQTVQSGWGGGNFYAATPNRSRNGANNSTYSALKPVELEALDAKMDDGAPNTGNIMSGFIHDNPPNLLTTTTAEGPDTACVTQPSGTTYSLSNSQYVCTPIIRMGVAAGDLQ